MDGPVSLKPWMANEATAKDLVQAKFSLERDLEINLSKQDFRVSFYNS